jgi:hypothetical protein
MSLCAATGAFFVPPKKGICFSYYDLKIATAIKAFATNAVAGGSFA